MQDIHLPFRYWVPTYDQLFSVYGRSEEDGSDERESLERYHSEELERSNRERRYIYKHIESVFSK